MTILPINDPDPSGDSEASTWTDSVQNVHELLRDFLGPEVSEQAASDGDWEDFWGLRALVNDDPDSETGFPTLHSRELRAGEILGRFRIEEEVGRGGFGIVYKAFDRRLGRAVALKIPRPDRVQSHALLERFAREIRLTTTLDHTAIVPVRDAGVTDGIFYITSVFQDGETLSRWMARHPAGLPPEDAATLVAQLASGLQHAHEKKVLHRDMKPGNVLMTPVTGFVPGSSQIEGYNPKITDFGLGTFVDSEAETQSGFWQGSPPYMAPEQVLPDLGGTSVCSDIYARGAILYELLTGRPIYPQRSVADLAIRLSTNEPVIRPRKLRRDIPLDLESICLKCLERQPGDRYQSAEALREDLLRFLCGQPTQARRLPHWDRAARWVKRSPALALVAGGLLIAVMGMICLWIVHVSVRQESGLELRRYNSRLTGLLGVLSIREAKARQRAYGSDLRLADLELDTYEVEPAQIYLERQIPEPGTTDLREFAWSLLWRRVTSSYQRFKVYDAAWLQQALGEGAVPEEAQTRFNRLQTLRGFSGHLNFRPGVAVASNERWAWFYRENGDRFARITEDDDLVLFDQGQVYETGLKASAVALSPDGRTVVISDPTWYARNRGAIEPRIGSIELGSDRSRLEVVTIPRAHEISFSGQGNLLAALLDEPKTKTCVPWFHSLAEGWSVRHPNMRRNTYLGQSVRVTLSLSTDGELAALSGEKPWLTVFKPRSGLTHWEIPERQGAYHGRISAMAFSQDGLRLALGYSTGSLRIRLTEDGRVIKRASPSRVQVSSLAFCCEGRELFVFSANDPYVRIWHPDVDPRTVPQLVHGDEVWALQFSRDSRTLFSAGDDHRIVAWDMKERKPSRTMLGHPSLVSAIALAPDGQLLASGDYEGQVNFWNSDTGELEETFESLLPGKVRTLAWSPDGRFLVAGGNTSSLAIWDHASRIWRGLKVPMKDCYCATFSPDGTQLILGSHDTQLAVLKVPDFSLETVLETEGGITALAIRPDGKQLVTGHATGAIRLWEFPTLVQQKIQERGSERGTLWALAYSPDGRTLASAGEDTIVRLWSPRDLDLLTQLEGHHQTVRGLAFSPDGKVLSSGDLRGLSRLWIASDQPSGQQVQANEPTNALAGSLR